MIEASLALTKQRVLNILAWWIDGTRKDLFALNSKLVLIIEAQVESQWKSFTLPSSSLNSPTQNVKAKYTDVKG